MLIKAYEDYQSNTSSCNAGQPVLPKIKSLMQYKNATSMKAILTTLLASHYLCSFAQGAKTLEDTCFKRKPLPCQGVTIRNSKIDTIEPSRFNILVEELYCKMSSSQELTINDDRTLVLLMNTINWSELDNQDQVQINYPRLKSIANLFEKS